MYIILFKSNLPIKLPAIQVTRGGGKSSRPEVVTLILEYSETCFTVAPLTFPVQEVSSSPSQITIEMHMHDGPQVGTRGQLNFAK